MSLNRFTVLTVLCIAMTPRTQALESSKQRKAGCEISTFHDEEERFQFVIVRFRQPNIEELWVCDAGLDLNRVFEELLLPRQCEYTSHLLELFCNKTLPGLNKLESTETSNDTDNTIIARVGNALTEIKYWKNMYIELRKHFFMVIRAEQKKKIIAAGILFLLLVWTIILFKLYDKTVQKLISLLIYVANKSPTIPFSMIYAKKHGSEKCLLIKQEVLLNRNNLNTNKTHNDSTSIGVIESNEDHDDIQINTAAIIPKLHSPHQDVINTNQIVIEVNHEALISRKPLSSDQDDIYTNQTGIEANHEASSSRKSLSSDQDDNYTNSTGIKANHEASTSRRPHSSDQDVIITNKIVIEANHEAFISQPHSSNQDDIYTHPTGIEANHAVSICRRPHTSDQDVIYTNPTGIEANHETSISRKPHRPYQVSVNQIGELEKEDDVNQRTSFISFDQASCNLSNETKLTSTSQASLASNMLDDRRSTCSSDISFRTASVRYYDSSSLSVSSRDSGWQDDRVEQNEEFSSEQGIFGDSFDREYL